MKRLNNKGFAVSTILYSLIIMLLLIVTMIMTIMASNRSNNRDLVEAVENELVGIDSRSMTLITNDEEKTLPFEGLYRIELSNNKNYYSWYMNLNKNCKVKYKISGDNSSIEISACGTYDGNYSSVPTAITEKIELINAYSSTKNQAHIEFVGENISSIENGKISTEEIKSGNYYVNIKPNSKQFFFTNSSEFLTPSEFNQDNTWNITTMTDVYAATGASGDTKGNRILDINSHALKLDGTDPANDTELKITGDFDINESAKKWVFEKVGTDNYYICNVENAVDLKICKSDAFVLTFVPNDPLNPDDGGNFKLRKRCVGASCSDSDIQPDYQKFNLYRIN